VLDDAAPTLIAVGEDADAAHLEGPAEVVRLPTAERGLDLHALLAALCDRGVGTVLLEGGPTLAGSFLADDLIDRVVGYVAPVLIGGGGLSSLGGPGAPSIDLARRLELVEVHRIGRISAWWRSPSTGPGLSSRCSPAATPSWPNETRNTWPASARRRPSDPAPMLAGVTGDGSEEMA
jgi:diaminohydroxyphosphoribosylaminopyrimidine deaminase/5-amino-6-(5-phosphoribosylamino)uracil reductase